MERDAPFAFSVPTAVQFGEGVSAKLPEVLPASATRIAVVRGGQGLAAAPLVEQLRARGLTVSEVPCPTEPSVASVNAAVDTLRTARVEALVACGGGAVLDSGKAIAFCLSHDLRLTDEFSDVPPELLAATAPLPLIAIPTTAGTGAEVTANAVLDVPSKQAKISLRGRALVPGAALVDPLLLPTAPPSTVLASGLDAVVQTLEAYTSAAATPFSDALTAPNLESGLRALRDVVETGDPVAWRSLAWVSLSSGLALANSGLGAAHGLASVLGGRYGAAHGALCGRFLIPVLRRNAAVAPQGTDAARRVADCRSAIARVFVPRAGADALSGLETWIDAQGLPGLRAMGLQRAEIETLAVASAGASSSKKNAVALGAADFVTILEDAI